MDLNLRIQSSAMHAAVMVDTRVFQILLTSHAVSALFVKYNLNCFFLFRLVDVKCSQSDERDIWSMKDNMLFSYANAGHGPVLAMRGVDG
jgi:hypothetical protein